MAATSKDNASPARHYRIQRLVYMDTDTAVYLAEDTSDQTAESNGPPKQVILKVGISPLGQKAIEHEAALLTFLRHPHIISILDFGVVHESLFSDDEASFTQSDLVGSYLVVPYLDGGDLDQRLQQPLLLSLPECLQIGQDIATGLAYLHAHNIIHRDVKPANILLSHQSRLSPPVKNTVLSLLDDVRAVLCDLGLAQQLDPAGTAVTAGLGTAAFMAPEQWRGDALGPATDIYAFGVVLFQLFTGQLPFMGDSTSAFAHAHLQQPPPAPCDVNPRRVTPDLETILAKCLAKQMVERYQHASEVGYALNCCTRDLVINASIAAATAADAVRGAVGNRERLYEQIGQICPQCGRLRPRQWGTCTRCGWPTMVSVPEDASQHAEAPLRARITSGAQMPTQARPPAAPTSPSYCPECNYPCRPGALLCLQCGADIDAQRRALKAQDALPIPCWHCGVDNPLTTRFCLSCGSPLG